MDDLTLAKKLLEIGDKNGALKELSRILKSNPNNIEAWLLWAQTTDNINYKKDCYRSVLRIDPNNIQAEKELKILLSAPQANTELEIIPEVSNSNKNIKNISRSESKGKDLLQILVSDRVFKIAISILIGFLLIIFGISLLPRPKASAPVPPTLTQSGPLKIIILPTNTTITPPPSYTPQATKTPYPTRTPKPTSTPTQFLWSGPARNYVPFEYPLLQSNYVIFRDDERTSNNAEFAQVEFALSNIHSGLARPAMYTFQIVVANTVEHAKLEYDSINSNLTEDSGDWTYQLGGSGYKSTLIDDAVTFVGTNFTKDNIELGRAFRAKNVVITITINYFSILPFPEASSTFDELNALTDLIVMRFK